MIDSVEVDQMERKLDYGDEREPDGNLFKLIGVAVALALAAGFFLPSPAQDAEVPAAIVEEVSERACIAQYAAGERWTKKPVCALGTRDVPATALSYPLAQKEAK